MGMQYKDNDEKYISQSWIDSVNGLRHFLSSPYTTLDRKQSFSKVQIGPDDTLNRVSLGAIVDFFVTNDPLWASLRQTVLGLHSLSRVSRLRN